MGIPPEGEGWGKHSKSCCVECGGSILPAGEGVLVLSAIPSRKRASWNQELKAVRNPHDLPLSQPGCILAWAERVLYLLSCTQNSACVSWGAEREWVFWHRFSLSFPSTSLGFYSPRIVQDVEMADFRVGVREVQDNADILLWKNKSISVYSAMETCHESQFEGALWQNLSTE